MPELLLSYEICAVNTSRHATYAEQNIALSYLAQDGLDPRFRHMGTASYTSKSFRYVLKIAT